MGGLSQPEWSPCIGAELPQNEEIYLLASLSPSAIFISARPTASEESCLLRVAVNKQVIHLSKIEMVRRCEGKDREEAGFRVAMPLRHSPWYCANRILEHSSDVSCRWSF